MGEVEAFDSFFFGELLAQSIKFRSMSYKSGFYECNESLHPYDFRRHVDESDSGQRGWGYRIPSVFLMRMLTG